MAAPLINTSQILDSYRKSDAVLIVCQNNSKQSVEIVAINEEAARVLGYGNDQLTGKPLLDIVPERIGAAVSEFVEYDNDNSDLQAVLNKIRNFSVKTATGYEAEFKLRVIRGDEIERNPWFHLVLVDEGKERKSNEFRETLRANFSGNEVADVRTMLPNRLSILKNLELVVYHVCEKDIAASFAIIDINHHENLVKEHGAEIISQLYKHMASVCRLKLRAEDVIATLSERSIGIILVDALQEPARMVLNRLRWAIGASPLELPKKDLVAQVNISFSQIDGKIAATEVLERCEAFSIQQRKQFHNAVQLVVTHERRDGQGGTERRKVNIPVAVDRRRRDRRKL